MCTTHRRERTTDTNNTTSSTVFSLSPSILYPLSLSFWFHPLPDDTIAVQGGTCAIYTCHACMLKVTLPWLASCLLAFLAFVFLALPERIHSFHLSHHHRSRMHTLNAFLFVISSSYSRFSAYVSLLLLIITIIVLSFD